MQRDGGKSSASAVARDRDPLRIEAEARRAVREPGKRRRGVFHRGREGVLRRKP